MSSIAKIACAFAENLPIQVERQRLGADVSLIITHPVEGTTVFAMSDDVAEAGVRVGISVFQARQITPSALVVEPDEAAYHARHNAIRAALAAFSPAIETLGWGEFLVDARGLERSYKSDQVIAEAMCAAARLTSGLSIRVGLAVNKFTAGQAARHALPDGACIVPAGSESRCLAPLPVSVLPNLPGEMRRRLQLLDIHTLGDLSALKKAAVLRQFGAEAASLYELARGNDPRPLNPDAPPLRIVRSLQLNSPVADRRILLNAANRLAWRLSQTLEKHGYHAEAILLTLLTASGERLNAGQAVKPPTSDESRLSRQAAQLLGRLRVTAPVVSLALSAYPLRPWHTGMHQMALVEAGVLEKQARLEGVIQLLWRRFGQTAVKIAALLGPPMPIKVRAHLNAAGLPARLQLGGEVKVVMDLDEAWREERRWWDLRPIRRDYFRVVLTDGSLRNIFQDLLSGEWYLDRAWPIL